MTKERGRGPRLPAVVWVTFAMTLLASGVQTSVLGFRFTGLAWSVPLVLGATVSLERWEQVRFPLRIWAPWITVVAAYQVLATAPNSLQRSVMILAPLATAMAASTFRARERDLELFLTVARGGAVILALLLAWDTRILVTGVLPFSTGLAPAVMTGGLLCAVFASAYAHGRTHYIWLWAAAALIPVVAVTRMGMVATAISLPFTFAPLRPARRVLFAGVIAFLGLAIFQTERVQRKMFFSGEGRLEDVRFNNPEFATSGRSVFWELMWNSIGEAPVFGHGANSSEEMLSSYIPGLTHPHNDWLRLFHDYGFAGTLVFTFTLLAQTVDLVRRGRRSSGPGSILHMASASAVLIFALFMTTDNIILYAAFFGHLQFCIIGLTYGAVPAAAGAAVRRPPWHRPPPPPRAWDLSSP